MEIRDKHSLTNFPAYVKQIRNEQPKSADRSGAKVAGGPEGDNVHLSPAARQIQQAKKTMAALPDMDEARVARLRDQIQDGTYRIDATRVAVKMIEDAFLGEDTRGDAGD